MSRTAKATLCAAIVGSTFTIYWVHRLQQQERDNMYEGVLKDDERRKQKMKQRMEEQEENLRKQQLYEKFQTVSDNGGGV